MRIGVLAVQGDIEENLGAVRAAMKKAGSKGEAVPVRTPAEISKSDALVIPGGESTVMGNMCLASGAIEEIKKKIASGTPVLGICAGLVMLSGDVADRVKGRTGQPLLGELDVTLERNSFGRQSKSFEAEVSMGAIGIPKFRGIFIRAPSVSRAGPGVEVLAKLGDRIIAVKKGKIIATAFHPELAGDLALHRHFLGLL